ncbi:MAG TPA: hypothetical protein VF595_09105 [Tepidisphaeraceae bacterium]
MPAFAKTTATKAAAAPDRSAINTTNNRNSLIDPTNNDTDDNTSPTGPVLPDDEMDQIVRLVQDKYGPILDINQAAEVSKLAKHTIRERVCYGMYAESVVRGRPLRFWAHRFVKEVMRP